LLIEKNIKDLANKIFFTRKQILHLQQIGKRMDNKLKEEEEKHIKMLLSTKPKPEHEETKKWIDQEVKKLYKKYRTANKLF